MKATRTASTHADYRAWIKAGLGFSLYFVIVVTSLAFSGLV